MHLNLVTIFTILALHVSGQRISDIKCEEYSNLAHNESIQYPHMVSIGFRDHNQRYNHVCDGAIISDRYILSVVDCLTPSLNLVYINHNNFTTENDESGTTFFGIKRRILSRYSSEIVFMGDVALIELNTTMKFDTNFRPACLWTKNYLDVNELKSIGWYHSTYDTLVGDTPDLYLTETTNMVVSKEKCNNFLEYKKFFPNGLLNSELFCVEHTLDDESEWIQGSHPIQIKKPNNYHIFGVFTFRFNYSPKIVVNLVSEIDWIESIVWYGNHTGEFPTLKITNTTTYPSTFTIVEPREINLKITNTTTYPSTFTVVEPRELNLVLPTTTTTTTVKPVVLECGERKVKHKAYITFSLPTYHGQFPWHVALNRRESAIQKSYICGGSILTNRIVITAAHCTTSELGTVNPELITVEIGRHRLDLYSGDSREIEVFEVIPHEEYDLSYLENDIAILKLKTLIEFTNFIQPICLTNDETIFTSEVGVVAGWGRDETNTQSAVLLQASLPIRSNTDCRQSNRAFFPNYLNDFNFCAGYQNGTNVCTGDSGGGMIFEVNGRFYLRGIVSLGVAIPNEDRCDISQLVLFTNVVKFCDWILSKY